MGKDRSLLFQITRGSLFSVFAWFWFSQSCQLLGLSVCLDSIGAHVVYVSRVYCSIFPTKVIPSSSLCKACYKAVAPAPNTIG